MHEQDISRRQVGQKIFRAPAQPRDRLALQPSHEIPLQRKSQITPARLDMGDAHGAKGQSGMTVWQSSHSFIRARIIEIFDAYLLSCPLDDRSEADRASNMLMGVADYFAATLAKAA